MRRTVIAAAFVVAALAALPSASGASAPARYYLALGDSLSQGTQPNASGASLYTNQGYVNDLYQAERRRIPNLKLVDVGCGGDTTTSLLTGHGNARDARLYRCDRKGGSQLKAAELFLRAHHQPGEVPLITIDIGANDVDGCVTAPNLARCVIEGEASIKHNVPLILRGLKRAARRGAAFAGMTLYDPVLAGYFSSVSSTRSLAAVSVALLKQVNGLIISADHNAGFRTADVADVFDSYDQALTVKYNGQLIPVDVARVCSWTWACTPPPSGPNIHANKNGYAEIAGAFERVIGRLR
jgi:lysophospholipase L1-like esterase